jgi:hypothetical protein
MVAIILKLLMTYFVFSILAGLVAAGFDCPDVVIKWLLFPPALLFLGLLAVGFMAMIWSW